MATDATKHYVRVEGWERYARIRLQKVQRDNPTAEGLRYFTLCGSEAIDVFQLRKEGLLRVAGTSTPDVVFCENSPGPFLDASRRLRGSKGYPDLFEDLVLNGNRFDRHYPFDLYNLDFTGVALPKSEAPFSKTLRAIEKVITKQGGHQCDFTLFVTFRPDRSGENDEAVLELIEELKVNIVEYLEYRDLYDRRIGLDPAALAASNYTEFLARAFPKLVLSLSMQHGFDGNVREIFKYSRPYEGGSFDIIKFIFEFEVPRGKNIKEKTQIARMNQYRYKVSVCGALTTAVRDVQKALAETPGLIESLQSNLGAITGYRDSLDKFNSLGPTVS
jgi:hypothetical protein